MQNSFNARSFEFIELREILKSYSAIKFSNNYNFFSGKLRKISSS